MKKLIIISILILLVSCIGSHRVEVWKTMSIASGDSIIINQLKAPATISIKNLSDEKVKLASELSMPKKIEAMSDFSYRLPKKSRLILVNSNAKSVSLHLHYSSNKPIMINNKELR